MELQDELHCRDREISRLTQERLALIKDAREGRPLFVIPFIFSCPYSLLLHNFADREQLQTPPHRYADILQSFCLLLLLKWNQFIEVCRIE